MLRMVKNFNKFPSSSQSNLDILFLLQARHFRCTHTVVLASLRSQFYKCYPCCIFVWMCAFNWSCYRNDSNMKFVWNRSVIIIIYWILKEPTQWNVRRRSDKEQKSNIYYTTASVDYRLDEWTVLSVCLCASICACRKFSGRKEDRRLWRRRRGRGVKKKHQKFE